MNALRKWISVIMGCLLSLFFSGVEAMPALAYATVDAVIPVSGLYVKDTPSHAYEIRIEPENEYAPAPVSDTLTVMENGTGYFEINITEPGTFRYTVYELAGDDLKVSDDNTVTGYDTVTPLESGSILHLNVKRTAEATPADETPNADFNYVVSYDQGADDPSTRTDTISNTREGGLQAEAVPMEEHRALEGRQIYAD